MTTHKSLLCVGGPLAGQRRAVLHGSGFVVMSCLKPLPDPEAEDYRPNKKIATQAHYYRAELFNTPSGEVMFWVSRDQTPLETLEMLLSSYEQVHSPAKVRR